MDEGQLYREMVIRLVLITLYHIQMLNYNAVHQKPLQNKTAQNRLGDVTEKRVEEKESWNKLDYRNGNPLQYSCLENPIDRGALWATVHGVAKSLT